MRVEGTRAFEAPRERVWAVVSDPAEMVRLMDGAEDFEVVDATHWRAKIRLPIGPGLKLAMRFEQLEERVGEFSSMRGTGKALGAGVQMTTSFALSGEGERTDLAWVAEVVLSGFLASMGEQALEPIVSRQVDGIMSALEERLRRP